MNVDILGIGELKWAIMGELNSDDHYIYYCGQESLRRNGVAITVNKRVQNAVLGCNVKNDRMISVHIQGKPFNITVIQVYAPNSNAEDTGAEWFYENLQDLQKLTPIKIICISSLIQIISGSSLQTRRCFSFCTYIVIWQVLGRCERHQGWCWLFGKLINQS